MVSEIEEIEAALLKCGTPVYDLTKPGRHVLVDVAEAAAAIAALRAQDREGAREMRERAAQKAQAWAVMDGVNAESSPQTKLAAATQERVAHAIASAIRVLPLSPVRMEDGRDA